jgi:hypothetical protein
LTAERPRTLPEEQRDFIADRRLARQQWRQLRLQRRQCEATFTVLPSTPPVVGQIHAGTCVLSHLGNSITTGSQTINFATLTQSAQRTFIAANGDELHATSRGTSKPGNGPGLIDVDATLTVVGGTGCFANATGQIHDWGTANTVTHVVFMLDGWITYDASAKAKQ